VRVSGRGWGALEALEGTCNVAETEALGVNQLQRRAAGLDLPDGGRQRADQIACRARIVVIDLDEELLIETAAAQLHQVNVEWLPLRVKVLLDDLGLVHLHPLASSMACLACLANLDLLILMSFLSFLP